MVRTGTVVETLVVQPRLSTSAAVSVAGCPPGSVVKSALSQSAGLVSVPFVIVQWTLVHQVATSAGWLTVARFDEPAHLEAWSSRIAGGVMERTPTGVLMPVVHPRLSTTETVSVAGCPFGSVLKSTLSQSAGLVSVPLAIVQWALTHQVATSAGWPTLA